MNIKRFTYNTFAIIVSFVLVFGSYTEVFGVTTFKNIGSTPNQNQVYMNSPATFNSGDPNNVSVLDSRPTYEPLGGANLNGPVKVDAQSKDAQTPPNVASSTGNGTVPGGAKAITANLLGCSAGQILASVITTGITTALNGLNALFGAPMGALVTDSQLIRTQGFATAVEQGFQIFGVYVGVSLNSIAYCIVNSILEYIANSTIAWANSGFNGNPAFIQNPERFFQGLADQQASQFINALAYNTATKGVSMNVCEPFRRNVALNLANIYGQTGDNTAPNGGFASRSSCGIPTQALNNFISGKDRSNYWNTATKIFMNDNNSFIGSSLNANSDLTSAIARRAATELEDTRNGQGFRSPVVCVDPNDRNTCNVVVQGSTVNKSLQNTLNLGQNRLVAATRFDQVVSAIVNNLIRVALNKLLTPVGIGVPAGANFLNNKSPYVNYQAGQSTGQGYNNGQAVPKATPASGGNATYGNVIPKALPVAQ